MGTADQRLVGRRKDGQEFPADISLSPLREGRSRLVIAAVRDATERVAAEAALHQNEARWRFLVEDMQLAVVALDEQRHISYTNPFLCQLTGYTSDEIIGRDALDVLLPPAHHDDARTGFGELLVDNVRRVYEGPIVTKCGERRYMRWRNTRVLDDAGRPAGSLSVGEDVTDAHDIQRRLEAVTEVSQAILARRPTDDVLRLVAARARALGHADVATFAMYAETPDAMVIRVADGHRADELEGTKFPTASTASGAAMATGSTEEVADASHDPRKRQPIMALGDFGPSLFVPLLVAGRPFGTLALARRTGRAPFDAHDIALVEAFATQASVALEYQRLAEELDQASPG
jgi:PAS domain S-box-containing protein